MVDEYVVALDSWKASKLESNCCNYTYWESGSLPSLSFIDRRLKIRDRNAGNTSKKCTKNVYVYV